MFEETLLEEKEALFVVRFFFAGKTNLSSVVEAVLIQSCFALFHV